jgi:hypothetical protein
MSPALLRAKRNDGEAEMAARLFVVLVSNRVLPVVPQRLYNRQHLLESNEAATVEQLVLIDRAGQLGGIRREIIVRVGELPTLADRHLLNGRWITTFDKWDGRRL